jgi:hypothetical protein
MGTTPPFPVRPSDVIADVYGMVGEDLDEAIVDLLRECGCREPTTAAAALSPVDTVEDVVMFLARFLSAEPPGRRHAAG